MRFLGWKQRLESLPLLIGEFFASHTGKYTQPYRVCKHALVLDFGAKPSSLSWYPFWRHDP
jgi:hypothetical protein